MEHQEGCTLMYGNLTDEQFKLLTLEGLRVRERALDKVDLGIDHQRLRLREYQQQIESGKLPYSRAQADYHVAMMETFIDIFEALRGAIVAITPIRKPTFPCGTYSITQLVADGVTSIRMQKWANPFDHVRLILLRKVGPPELMLYCPSNTLINGHDPVSLHQLMRMQRRPIIDVITEPGWVPYSGPGHQSPEYKAEVQKFAALDIEKKQGSST